LTTLQTLHQCQRYDCVNFTRYCWRDLNTDQHYALILHHFVCWNKTLDNEILSVDFKISFLNVKENLISLTRKKDKKIDSQSSFSFSFMTFFQIHFSAYAFSFTVSFATSFASYSALYSASYLVSYSAQYAFQYSSQYASSHDFASHVFASHVSQHSNRFEKTLHSSSKSASISHVLFNSMKDHDLKIYIDWHIQSKSHKRKIWRFALNQLSEQKYDLQTIQTLKNADNRAFWQELNIFSNIEIQLIRDVSKFDREMTSRRRMSSSSSIFSFQKVVEWALSLNHELLENEKMTARLSTHNLQFTSFTSFTQNTMSFSVRILIFFHCGQIY
jgi:hypothetical protein